MEKFLASTQSTGRYCFARFSGTWCSHLYPNKFAAFHYFFELPNTYPQKLNQLDLSDLLSKLQRLKLQRAAKRRKEDSDSSSQPSHSPVSRSTNLGKLLCTALKETSPSIWWKDQSSTSKTHHCKRVFTSLRMDSKFPVLSGKHFSTHFLSWARNYLARNSKSSAVRNSSPLKLLTSNSDSDLMVAQRYS